MKQTISTSTKKLINGTFILLIACILASLVVSLFFFLISGTGTRKTFLFESEVTDSLSYEVRFLPKDSPHSGVRLYVEELLLGSMVPQVRPLFPAGTGVRSCFVRNNTLYLDLSAEAIQTQAGRPSETLVASELLRKNIFANFRNIDTIKLYIVGKEVSDRLPE